MKIITRMVLMAFTMLISKGEGQLSENFYNSSCPNVESIVSQAVTNKFTQTITTGQATLRLFFHDCFVEVFRCLFLKSMHDIVLYYWCWWELNAGMWCLCDNFVSKWGRRKGLHGKSFATRRWVWHCDQGKASSGSFMSRCGLMRRHFGTSHQRRHKLGNHFSS